MIYGWNICRERKKELLFANSISRWLQWLSEGLHLAQVEARSLKHYPTYPHGEEVSKELGYGPLLFPGSLTWHWSGGRALNTLTSTCMGAGTTAVVHLRCSWHTMLAPLLSAKMYCKAPRGSEGKIERWNTRVCPSIC